MRSGVLVVIQHYRRPRQVWSTLVLAGLLFGVVGVATEVAAASPASAAAVGACGKSMSLAPGAQGSCSETVSDTSNNTSAQVQVNLVVATTSTSGGGAGDSGIGTEAILDGRPGGLHVTVTDTTTGQTFSLGTIFCYRDSGKSAPATYPNAAYCDSSSGLQRVATNVNNASFTNTFLVAWSFPLAAGNPYQGAGATVQLQSTYVGATGSGTLGVSTGPSGGQLAASTPTTGAELPETLAQFLLSAGVLLAIVGALLFMRGQRNRPLKPPTSST